MVEFTHEGFLLNQEDIFLFNAFQNFRRISRHDQIDANQKEHTTQLI